MSSGGGSLSHTVVLAARANNAEFSVPVLLSVTIGMPVLSMHASDMQPKMSLEPLPEGQLGSSPPTIVTAPFHLDSLSKSTFTWKAALSLALTSKLAYESDQSVKSTCLGLTRSWGFGSCEFIDVDDTQCFVALTSEIALVSFRGTESRGDWLRNINVPGRTRATTGLRTGDFSEHFRPSRRG